MKFDPKVIEHLGVRMYSTIPPVLGELIANAYDADATKVEIMLYDKGEKKIVIRDDGLGMSFDDINEKFLVIGRNRREGGDTTLGGRKVIGKKGLGKLSFFGIVQTITINTVREGKRNIFTMDWNDLMNSVEGQYQMTPQLMDETVEGNETGTEITLTNIGRVTDFSEKDLAENIARFFIFDEDFTVRIRRNNGKTIILSNEMHFSAFDEEFSWSFPEDFNSLESDYGYRPKIKGKIITSKRPIPPKYNSRGVSLFSRSKLVQVPYQFSDSTSSHFFSYLTGWLEVDFIEDFPEDVISTNRQSLNWGHEQTNKLHKYLEECIKFVQLDWRNRRREKKENTLSQNTDIDMQSWLDSLPENMRNGMVSLMDEYISLEEIDNEKITLLITKQKKITPAYPLYHWRHLHSSLKCSLVEYYRNGQYMEAAQEGTKIYSDLVRKKSGQKTDFVKLFNSVFSSEKPPEKAPKKPPKKPILELPDFFKNSETKRNMQEGQRDLSVGLAKSFRHPTSHHVKAETEKFFNEDDCLDVLSLISFLLHRVDICKKNNPE